jgi:hypothetical protein
MINKISILDRIKNRKQYKILSDTGKRGANAGEYARMMFELFNKRCGEKIFNFSHSSIFNFFQPEFISNPERKWFQLWKPRMIKNPDYNSEPVEINIVRGAK